VESKEQPYGYSTGGDVIGWSLSVRYGANNSSDYPGYLTTTGYSCMLCVYEY
jgi:hypothetical protein